MKKSIITLILLSTFLCGTSYAIPIIYNASGDVSINGEAMATYGSFILEGDASISTLPSFNLNYDVLSFDLTFGDDAYHFYGDAGSIGGYSLNQPDLPLVPRYNLLGAGDWTRWSGDAISFYNINGEEYPITTSTDYSIPPYTIELWAVNLARPTGGDTLDYSRLRLEQAAPVPEPSTIMLLGFGIVVGGRLMKKKRARVDN